MEKVFSISCWFVGLQSVTGGSCRPSASCAPFSERDVYFELPNELLSTDTAGRRLAPKPANNPASQSVSQRSAEQSSRKRCLPAFATTLARR